MNNENVHDLQQGAIKAAISKNWNEAISINLAILEQTPDDVSTLNRLGIAHSMAGGSKKATACFKRVLEVEPENTIAKNNIARLKANHHQGLVNPFLQTVSFIEEPGKSKVIPLVSQGEPQIFSTLNIGEPVDISITKHKVKISKNKTFIGYLPDIISHRLLKLLNAGYKYKTVMKSVSAKSPQVFMQETKSTKRLRGIPSFPLDEKDRLPTLSAGESSEIPKLEIFDPLIGDES